jgi:hypothetical protein
MIDAFQAEYEEAMLNLEEESRFFYLLCNFFIYYIIGNFLS